jgi:holo-[acyl-carrier protein] synthase
VLLPACARRLSGATCLTGWQADVVIVGIGIDVVDVPRFVASLERAPAMVDRLFTESERVTDEGRARTETSLAARFAAKEAVAKALGAPQGMAWHDCEVVGDSDGRPWLRISGTVADAASAQGIDRWHLSLSHDGDVAVAYVIAESS